MDISRRELSCLPHHKSIQRDGGESARIREERHSFPNTKEVSESRMDSKSKAGCPAQESRVHKCAFIANIKA